MSCVVTQSSVYLPAGLAPGSCVPMGSYCHQDLLYVLKFKGPVQFLGFMFIGSNGSMFPRTLYIFSRPVLSSSDPLDCCGISYFFPYLPVLGLQLHRTQVTILPGFRSVFPGSSGWMLNAKHQSLWPLSWGFSVVKFVVSHCVEFLRNIKECNMRPSGALRVIHTLLPHCFH